MWTSVGLLPAVVRLNLADQFAEGLVEHPGGDPRAD
jgi:hypothetical protein